MCNNDSGSSLLDDIIVIGAIMYLLYVVFLAIPIIPYFDVLLKIVFSIHVPNSFLGGIFTVIVLLFAGFFMLEAIKTFGQKIFNNKTAMFFFLYGQGLVLIGLMGGKNTPWLLSTIITQLISTGFNEPLKIGKYYLIVTGAIALIISLVLEVKARSRKNSKK